MKSLLARHVDPERWGNKGMSPFNTIVCVLILGAVLVAIMETESTLRDPYQDVFKWTETILFAFFCLEYALRVYVAPLNERYQGSRWPRLRYVVSGWSLIDLAALVPFLLTAGSATFVYPRLIRLLRIIRLSRLGRFSSAWQLLWTAITGRRYELMMSGMVAFFLLIVSSTFLFLFESQHQPEVFGSIPRSLWWSVATLTTVGYGDVTPVTSMGKFFAGLTAITGIGLVAMPTGILAAAFSDAFQSEFSDEG